MTREQAIDGYVAMWNAMDGAGRRAAAENALAEDVNVQYASFEARNLDELVAAAESYRQDQPHFHIERLGPAQSHRDWARFAWRLTLDNGASHEGQTIVQFGEDGQLKQVAGFREPLEG